MPMPRILIPALGACRRAPVDGVWQRRAGRERPIDAKARHHHSGEPHHRRRTAEPGPERHQELGRAACGQEVGHIGRPRHRSEGRPRLGLRALRRGHGRRRPCRLRQQPGRSRLQVRPQVRQGAGEHRQGRHGDAARHPRGPGRQRVGGRLRGQQGGHQGPPGAQVQPEGREADEPGHRRQARQRRRPVQPAQRRRRRTRRQPSTSRTATTAKA